MANNIFDHVAELCRIGARASLDSLMALGPSPTDPGEEIRWRMTARRLRNNIDSLTNMASDLTAAAILLDLSDFEDELATIEAATKRAEKRIEEIEEISARLSKFGRILDLGLAVLAIPAAATNPSALASAVGGAVDAAKALRETGQNA